MQFAEKNKEYEQMIVAGTSKQYVDIVNDVNLLCSSDAIQV